MSCRTDESCLITMSCGHVFHMVCVKEYLDKLDKEEAFNCPQCRQMCNVSAESNRNAMLKDIIEKLKDMEVDVTLSSSHARPDDVPCDMCTGRKLGAVKTCLTCMASYCETHLRPHRDSEALRRHKMEELIRKHKEKLCTKVLQIFCKTEHNTQLTLNSFQLLHLQVFFSTRSSAISPQSQLENMKAEIENRIQQKEKKLEEENQTLEKIEVSVVSRSGGTKHYITSQMTAEYSTHFLFASLLYSDSFPLTLDPNTANRWLQLSEGNKMVTFEKTVTGYPDHPDRFDKSFQVLGKEGLSESCFYWEVEWTGDRCLLGFSDKSWCLSCSCSSFSVWHNNKKTYIFAPFSRRIGVFLDCPAGSLSFYSVSDTTTLMYRFNASFTEPLYPGFWVSPNSSASPVAING
uniref:Uncharacterized protein n=1 Tax=Erpetoichthys calabaricus TaxID=27687 RepID=A0A8C4TI69_ERPCA